MLLKSLSVMAQRWFGEDMRWDGLVSKGVEGVQCPSLPAVRKVTIAHLEGISTLVPLLNNNMSRKTGTISGKGTIPEPSTPHIGQGVAFVYI
jgi:hypothetical protein